MGSQNMEVVACFKQGLWVADSSKVKGHPKSAHGGLSVSVTSGIGGIRSRGSQEEARHG